VDLTADATTREHDTFPKLARANAARMPDHVAIREKDYGIWQSSTWSDYLARARAIALGLASLPFRRGDKVAIIGDNRPELYWAVLATQALGGVPVPLYQDSSEKEMEYIIDTRRRASRSSRTRSRSTSSSRCAPAARGSKRSCTTIRGACARMARPAS